MNSCIEVPCTTLVKIHLSIYFTRDQNIFDVSRWSLRNVVVEALFIFQHLACSFVTNSVSERLYNLDGLKLTVEHVRVYILI